VSQEELLRGRFLHVVRDHVRLPDGSPATREYVIHPGAVVVVSRCWTTGAWCWNASTAIRSGR
jgi:hypothetical protein